MKEWMEMAGVFSLAVLMVAGAALGIAVCVAMYGAFFGAIGFGAYAAFMWLVALFAL